MTDTMPPAARHCPECTNYILGSPLSRPTTLSQTELQLPNLRDLHRSIALEEARRRISAACAEYDYFRPTGRCASFTNGDLFSNTKTPTTDSLGYVSRPPDPEIMKLDLRALYARIVAEDEDAVDKAYVNLAAEMRRAANCEHVDFVWGEFLEMLGRCLEGLRVGEGCTIEIGDLDTFRSLPGSEDEGRAVL